MSVAPEEQQTSAERSIETNEVASEQLERAREAVERKAEISERDSEQTTEQARIEALESSKEAAPIKLERKHDTESNIKNHRGPINKKQRDASFKKTIQQVQAELPATQRTFSKIIHNKAIEKASDIVGSTIARPDAILSGAIVAFVLTLLVYVIAKNMGYALSGFESMAAFVIGWVIGLIYDYLRVLVTGKKY